MTNTAWIIHNMIYKTYSDLNKKLNPLPKLFWLVLVLLVTFFVLIFFKAPALIIFIVLLAMLVALFFLSRKANAIYASPDWKSIKKLLAKLNSILISNGFDLKDKYELLCSELQLDVQEKEKSFDSLKKFLAKLFTSLLWMPVVTITGLLASAIISKTPIETIMSYVAQFVNNFSQFFWAFFLVIAIIFYVILSGRTAISQIVDRINPARKSKVVLSLLKEMQYYELNMSPDDFS